MTISTRLEWLLSTNNVDTSTINVGFAYTQYFRDDTRKVVSICLHCETSHSTHLERFHSQRFTRNLQHTLFNTFTFLEVAPSNLSTCPTSFEKWKRGGYTTRT